MNLPDVQATIQGLTELRLGVCAYANTDCDCKYGYEAGEQTLEQTGCPELRAAIWHLKRLERFNTLIAQMIIFRSTLLAIASAGCQKQFWDQSLLPCNRCHACIASKAILDTGWYAAVEFMKEEGIDVDALTKKAADIIRGKVNEVRG